MSFLKSNIPCNFAWSNFGCYRH